MKTKIPQCLFLEVTISKVQCIQLIKPYVVRAVAKNSKGEFSEINSRTYFVTTDELAVYQDFTVVSIVTNPENLYDPDIGIYVTGTMYQEWKKSDEYDPKQSPWDKNGKCNYFQRGKEWEREAFVTIFEKGEKLVQQNMGIIIKGASTRNNAGKSFNLHAKKKYGKSSLDAELFKDNYDIKGKLIEGDIKIPSVDIEVPKIKGDIKVQKIDIETQKIEELALIKAPRKSC